MIIKKVCDRCQLESDLVDDFWCEDCEEEWQIKNQAMDELLLVSL
jgi:hypothetical protein